MTSVYDANILIDVLNGFEIARQEVKHQSDRAISIVTWMEVLIGALPEEEDVVRRLLSEFRLVGLSNRIAEQAVLERRDRRIKLPDAVAVATAVIEGGVLVTRNTRDFPKEERYVRIPYVLPRVT